MTKKSRLYASVLLEVLKRVPQSRYRLLLRRFKKALEHRGDMKVAPAVVLEFKKMWEERKGTIGEVVSAKPLRGTIKKKGFVWKKRVDPNLIGGVILFLGSEYMIDNSVRGKLQKLWRKNTFLTF